MTTFSSGVLSSLYAVAEQLKETYCMMEAQVKLIALFVGILIYLSGIAWVLGRRMEIFSAPAVEVDPLCLE